MSSVKIFSGKPDVVENKINEFLQSDETPKIVDLKLSELSSSESIVVLITYEIPEDEF